MTTTEGFSVTRKSLAATSSREYAVQRVSAGKVDDVEPMTVVRVNTLFFLHGHAGIIAHVAPGAGQRVEEGSLSGVGIAGQRDRCIHVIYLPPPR